MKKFSLFTFTLAALALMAFTGCARLQTQTAKLESGGAYAPMNLDGTEAAKPDLAYYSVEAAFRLAYSSIDTAYKFEHENSLMLWRLSPNIKKTLDDWRPKADEAVKRYGLARKAYEANRTSAGLSDLQSALSQVKAASAAISAALPKQ